MTFTQSGATYPRVNRRSDRVIPWENSRPLQTQSMTPQATSQPAVSDSFVTTNQLRDPEFDLSGLLLRLWSSKTGASGERIQWCVKIGK